MKLQKVLYWDKLFYFIQRKTNLKIVQFLSAKWAQNMFSMLRVVCYWSFVLVHPFAMDTNLEKGNLKVSMDIVTRKLKVWTITTQNHFSVWIEIVHQHMIHQHLHVRVVSLILNQTWLKSVKTEFNEYLCKLLLLFPPIRQLIMNTERSLCWPWSRKFFIGRLRLLRVRGYF